MLGTRTPPVDGGCTAYTRPTVADSTDAQLRLQNIALEHAELVARRSMSWAEATNRATMFMTVVGAAVVGLALFAQVREDSLPLLALVILSVVLVIGLTTFLRIGQLDDEDMRLIQGLNRLRHMRLELDPGLAPFLVTSPHDDFDSVIKAYGPVGASWLSGFATLAVLLLIVNSVLVGVVGGLVAANVRAEGWVAVLVGIVSAVGFAVASAFWFYRAISRVVARFEAVVPAPRSKPTPDHVTGTRPVREDPPQP